MSTFLAGSRVTVADRIDADSALSNAETVTLLHQHWRSLHGLAVSVLNDRDAAQDAVQDVLVAIIRRGQGFADAPSALSYARSAVINRCRSALRRRGTVHSYLRRFRDEAVVAPADERLLLDESSADVLRLFDTLPPRQREVLTLRYLHHLTDQEISDVVNVAAATVRSNASRALATLSRTLKSTQFPEGKTS